MLENHQIDADGRHAETAPPDGNILEFSNAVRLTGRQWLVVALFAIALLWLPNILETPRAIGAGAGSPHAA